MKLLKSLLRNPFVINLFIASVTVGILLGMWGLPKTFDSSSPSSVPSPSEPLEILGGVEPSPADFAPPPIPTPSLPDNQVAVSPAPIATPMVNPSLPPLPANLNNQPLTTSAEVTKVESNTAFKTKLGHFPYQENPRQRLVQVGSYYSRPEYLDQETSIAFKQIQSDARKQGVELIIISGFRSITDQDKLFQKQIQKRGSKKAAARLSAPPGYSEHHTGYALDIGDGKQPKTDLKFDFESTEAYQWLATNAYRYGFELSFPRNNPQGVSFEPWHWRYLGSQRAQQIFAITQKN